MNTHLATHTAESIDSRDDDSWSIDTQEIQVALDSEEEQIEYVESSLPTNDGNNKQAGSFDQEGWTRLPRIGSSHGTYVLDSLPDQSWTPTVIYDSNNEQPDATEGIVDRDVDFIQDSQPTPVQSVAIREEPLAESVQSSEDEEDMGMDQQPSNNLLRRRLKQSKTLQWLCSPGAIVEYDPVSILLAEGQQVFRGVHFHNPQAIRRTLVIFANAVVWRYDPGNKEDQDRFSSISDYYFDNGGQGLSLRPHLKNLRYKFKNDWNQRQAHNAEIAAKFLQQKYLTQLVKNRLKQATVKTPGHLFLLGFLAAAFFLTSPHRKKQNMAVVAQIDQCKADQ